VKTACLTSESTKNCSLLVPLWLGLDLNMVKSYPPPPLGTKKQAPAPPRQASPFTPQLGSQQTPGSAYHPPIAPKRHSGKESPQIHAPSHPPPQPPLSPTPPVAGGAGETDRSPPSTPTPPSTPPLDAPQPYPLVHPSFHSGSLPRPTRPAPKPRPRPSGPPPPQPPANEGENGLLNSASKVITGIVPLAVLQMKLYI
jgi:hypothetical protein